MKSEKIKGFEISPELEKNALKLLKKSFENQFGSTCFLGVKKIKKNELQDSIILQNIKNEDIEDDFKESPKIVTFSENVEGSTVVANKNTQFHSFKLSKFSDFFERKKSLKFSKKKDLENDQLKNDIALQRLLEESHFLKKGSDSSAFSLEPTGKQRHKIIENRIKLLGGKDVFKEKIPFKIRLGMKLKAKVRSEIAKKKAKEAGIVRALPTFKSKIKKKRNYGLNEITVGKYRKGMIILSQEDIKGVSSMSGFDRKNKRRKNNNIYNDV
ncbi:uncharacterized protein T551_00976 [Pneumocystis jirovecii RU7]|uniref:Uncharacterized protein n=1 Tax=Pneumocystis jirovecii (strain RU7) TaxID=1408657 RepID=A0A0W4ZTQ1_PNEJ7|nr:uncharacterized protein T551_00976 [Pneumocystis jirovecii RU7]KTW31715.1 hypothetical protein T551_00976 [Pneumocystis jirovecii RU7]